MKNLAIAILLAMLVWFGSAIIRLERYHYASMLGICERTAKPGWLEQQRCLNSIETRTGALWHLAYGLRLI
ncbi:MAG: hypothetical protein EOO77_20050 [Oxalobacteraceae bacterium]|nr:MAG: hypothetical protein EOO77_20050 [Oxalobacteraceae bacterium]